jgi:hypothetical protein
VNTKQKIFAGLVGAATVIILGSVAAGEGASDKVAVQPQIGTATSYAPQPTTEENKSTKAQLFRDCVAKGGLATEKAATKHVTKVKVADKMNNVLDTADVFTDLKGDMFGPNGGKAKLIASAFADCFKSENGLVTVHSESGELLATGNF